MQIQRYRTRISGPLLDRIDIHVEAPALSIEELRRTGPGEASGIMRERVAGAREKQAERFRGNPPGVPPVNARMSHHDLRRYCRLDSTLGDRLQDAMKKLHLSARAYDRILKVSRTIADIEDSEAIQASHLMEAINYRTLDRRHQNR